MREFYFPINEEYALVFSKSKKQKFYADEFDICLQKNKDFTFLLRDSLYFGIFPEMAYFFNNKNSYEYLLEEGYSLSKKLFDLKDDCFDEPYFDNCVTFYDEFMIILMKTKTAIYVEIAYVDIESNKYEFIMKDYVKADLQAQWLNSYNELKEIVNKTNPKQLTL
jgi:hypothetical protein